MPGAAAQTLVEVFLSWAGHEAGNRRLLTRRKLRCLAQENLPQGAAAAIRAMTDAWLAEIRASDSFAQRSSREIQEQLVLTFKAGPTNLKAEVPAKLRGQPGVFTTPAEWRERGYIMDDETRAKTLPAWKEWFNATIVAK